MSNLVINGTTFNGTPSGAGSASAWKPTGYTAREQKVGATLVAADGTRNRVERAVNKRVYEIRWEKCNLATMQTVRTIARLTTTFTLVDFEGASVTVQTEDELAPEWAQEDTAGASYWNVTLTLYER